MKPIPKEQLPDGSHIWTAQYRSRDGSYLIIVYEVHAGLATVYTMAEFFSIQRGVNALIARDSRLDFRGWVPVLIEGDVRYRQPDCITLAEALEAAVGTPPFSELCPHCGKPLLADGFYWERQQAP